MKNWFWLVAVALGMAVSTTYADAPAGKLELKDGDRVAFIGNTFVEREKDDGYIETMLTSRFPHANVTFRNLGYSADTVTGSARGLCTGWSTFEAADKAFDRLRKLVAEFKPTVLLINYGMTESFSGPEGIPTFTTNYNKMLDALSTAAGTSPRLVLMTPNYHEDLGRPLPDPAEHNKSLKLYSEAIRQIAAARDCAFIDLFSLTKAERPHLTSNGIHMTHYGYWETAFLIERALWSSVRKWEVDLQVGQNPKAIGTQLKDAKISPNGASFTATDETLATPPAPSDAPQGKMLGVFDIRTEYYGQSRDLKITGLKAGLIFGVEFNGTNGILAASPELWAQGMNLHGDPTEAQCEALRKLIVSKNFDFFNYQRPDNDSYILAFRKGEQGRNAVEIPQFLPLVEEKEKQIAELRVPKPVTYTLEALK